MMCDGSENPDKCRQSITKSLMCTNFMSKAQSLLQEDLEGLNNFVERCKSIERQVPNLSSVFHWVQNPEEVFNQAVGKAEAKTGISLAEATAALPQVNIPTDEASAKEDAELGLPPLGA